mmetsp:Transcript_39255/g.85395  ORF Transcript_39255/g.85395 Transcript_39255/m.85395 type:complete len:202 (+) Transcript_39255:704-1309(+)
MSPELLCSAAPVSREMPPLTPVVPESAVSSSMSPLEVDELNPDSSWMLPPTAPAAAPAVTSTSPPLPLTSLLWALEAPAVTMTVPPRLPLELSALARPAVMDTRPAATPTSDDSPAVWMRAPPSPRSPVPTVTEICPPVPPVATPVLTIMSPEVSSTCEKVSMCTLPATWPSPELMCTEPPVPVAALPPAISMSPPMVPEP